MSRIILLPARDDTNCEFRGSRRALLLVVLAAVSITAFWAGILAAFAMILAPD